MVVPEPTPSATVPVSVIVPCFNNADMLRECIDSIQSGTAPDQIVIVDDCSADGSLSVARDLACDFENILVLSMAANLGAATARRVALAHVRNDWVALIDADDFVEENAIAEALATAQRDGSDVCIWDMWRFENGESWRNIVLRPESFPREGREAVLDTLGGWRIHPLGVARTSLYIGAYADFLETMINADELITRLVLSKAQQISFCPRKYFYRVHSKSATQSLHERRLTSLDAHLWLMRFIRDYPEVSPERVGIDAIAQAWFFTRNHDRIGTQAVRRKLAEWLPRFSEESKLSSWIWRRPKHLAAFTAMTIFALGARNR